jgi:hypothetical protein
MHRLFQFDWSEIEVPPGNHISMGILVGQICSRILFPWNIGYKIKVPVDATWISRQKWEDSLQERAKTWATEKHLSLEESSPPPKTNPLLTGWAERTSALGGFAARSHCPFRGL